MSLIPVSAPHAVWVTGDIALSVSLPPKPQTVRCVEWYYVQGQAQSMSGHLSTQVTAAKSPSFAVRLLRTTPDLSSSSCSFLLLLFSHPSSPVPPVQGRLPVGLGRGEPTDGSTRMHRRAASSAVPRSESGPSSRPEAQARRSPWFPSPPHPPLASASPGHAQSGLAGPCFVSCDTGTSALSPEARAADRRAGEGGAR